MRRPLTLAPCGFLRGHLPEKLPRTSDANLLLSSQAIAVSAGPALKRVLLERDELS